LRAPSACERVTSLHGSSHGRPYHGFQARTRLRPRAGEELVSQAVGAEVATQAGAGTLARRHVVGVERSRHQARGADSIDEVPAVEAHVVVLAEAPPPL